MGHDLLNIEFGKAVDTSSPFHEGVNAFGKKSHKNKVVSDLLVYLCIITND